MFRISNLNLLITKFNLHIKIDEEVSQIKLDMVNQYNKMNI